MHQSSFLIITADDVSAPIAVVAETAVLQLNALGATAQGPGSAGAGTAILQLVAHAAIAHGPAIAETVVLRLFAQGATARVPQTQSDDGLVFTVINIGKLTGRAQLFSPDALTATIRGKQ